MLRAGIVVCAGIVLAGCVQTEPLRSAANDTATDLKKTLRGVVGAINPKEAPAREFQLLIKDSKYREAEAFLWANRQFFVDRYSKEPNFIEMELRPLTQYLWERDYKRLIPELQQKAQSISSFSEPIEWATQRALLTRLQSVLNDYTQNPAFRIDSIFNESINPLQIQLTRLQSLARLNRTENFKKTYNQVYESVRVPMSYPVGDFTGSEYQLSNEFQTFALKMLGTLTSAEGLKREASRRESLLSAQSKELINSNFNELLRKSMFRGGSLPIEKLGEFSKLADPPFKSVKSEAKQAIKIGFLDLTAEQFRDRNIFDFQIEFKRDLKVSFDDAKASVFGKSGHDFDFVFVTDLSLAKIKREFKNRKEVTSKFQSGVRPVSNPNYVTAFTNYQRSMSEFNRVQIESTRQDYCNSPLACALIATAKVASEAVARKNLDNAQAALNATPQQVDEPIYQAYQYREVEIASTKTARVDYYIIDVKGKRFYKNFFEYSDSELFVVAYGVREEDPDRLNILRRLKDEATVTRWEKASPQISLATLFNLDNLKLGTSQGFSSFDAFFKDFKSKSYVSAAPKFEQAQPVQGKGSQRGDVIADPRFDSVVLIKSGNSIGTGFYVTPDLILTAYHVVEKAALVEMQFFDGSKTFGKVVDHDVRLDLALIRPQLTGKPARIHQGPIRLGSTVEAIGHPRGLEFTITRGVVSALRKQKGVMLPTAPDVEFVQTDTPISPGNSGGPLFLGESVIGVNDFVIASKTAQNLNFSVSFNEIRNYLNRFTEGKGRNEK